MAIEDVGQMIGLLLQGKQDPWLGGALSGFGAVELLNRQAQAEKEMQKQGKQALGGATSSPLAQLANAVPSLPRPLPGRLPPGQFPLGGRTPTVNPGESLLSRV